MGLVRFLVAGILAGNRCIQWVASEAEAEPLGNDSQKDPGNQGLGEIMLLLGQWVDRVGQVCRGVAAVRH
jgi:hypothetical protein